MKKILVVCTTDSMIWNFLVPHVEELIKNNYQVDCACSETGFYFEELEAKLGFKINKIKFERSPYKINNIMAFKKLNNIVKKNHYDVIFCHEPVGGAIGRIVGKMNNCKVVYMAHGFHFFKGAPIISKLLYYNIEKFLSYFTDVLITINQEDYKASKRFKAKKNILLNGIGVDINKFKRDNSNYFKTTFNLKQDDFVLLSVGELSKRKNHEVIIDALSILNNPKIHYFIAGEGELQDYLEDKMKKCNLKDNVHLLGFCKNINELCNSCDIFIFPSTQEGLSVAVMEAMACGKAIICSKIRGNMDLIDEKGGILIDTNDIISYSSAIEFCVNNPEYITRFGTYNSKKIKNYDVNRIKKQIVNIFKNLEV